MELKTQIECQHLIVTNKMMVFCLDDKFLQPRLAFFQTLALDVEPFFKIFSVKRTSCAISLHRFDHCFEDGDVKIY